MRGLGKKARQIAESIRLWEELSTGVKPSLNPTRLSQDALVTALAGAGLDYQNLTPANRQIQFYVDSASFKNVSDIFVDYYLFEQAIFCILDNVSKYSFPQTTVTISVLRRTKE